MPFDWCINHPLVQVLQSIGGENRILLSVSRIIYYYHRIETFMWDYYRRGALHWGFLLNAASLHQTHWINTQNNNFNCIFEHKCILKWNIWILNYGADGVGAAFKSSYSFIVGFNAHTRGLVFRLNLPFKTVHTIPVCDLTLHFSMIVIVVCFCKKSTQWCRCPEAHAFAAIVSLKWWKCEYARDRTCIQI